MDEMYQNWSKEKVEQLPMATIQLTAVFQKASGKWEVIGCYRKRLHFSFEPVLSFNLRKVTGYQSKHSKTAPTV